MCMPLAHTNAQSDRGDRLHRLCLYTNYDCNLSCSYCVAECFVGAERNGLALPQVYRLIDEAVTLGMTELFLTGGEPFILHDIFSMLRYGLERMRVTVLSNGILLKGKRLGQLEALPHRERLIVQISLDGSNAATHDVYRGTGSWQKAIDAIVRLKSAGFHVRLGTTQTPENSRTSLQCAGCIARLASPMKTTSSVLSSAAASQRRAWLFPFLHSNRK